MTFISDSDDDTCDSDAVSRPSTSKKCPPRNQSFNDNWLQITEFKSWLSKRLAPDRKSKPFCKVCTCWLTCAKTSLKRHAESQKHQGNVKLSRVGKTHSIDQLVRQTATSDTTTSMEVKLCAFIAEHNLPLSLSESMMTLIRSLCPNDAALSRVKLGKQKATNIIRQVLGFDYLKEMVSLLRSRKFGIIIDEATDKSVKKQLAIVATFFDVEKFEVQYWLVDMVETEDGTAAGIYAK